MVFYSHLPGGREFWSNKLLLNREKRVMLVEEKSFTLSNIHKHACIHTHIHIYTSIIRYLFVRPNSLSNQPIPLYRHAYTSDMPILTHICMWNKNPSSRADKTHSFWMKRKLQLILNRKKLPSLLLLLVCKKKKFFSL